MLPLPGIDRRGESYERLSEKKKDKGYRTLSQKRIGGRDYQSLSKAKTVDNRLE